MYSAIALPVLHLLAQDTRSSIKSLKERQLLDKMLLFLTDCDIRHPRQLQMHPLCTSMERFDDSQLDISLHEEYTPKRHCVTRGTTFEISKRFVKELGPAADRLNLSS